MKAIVQKGISFLPFKHTINYFFQKNFSGGIKLTDEWFSAKILQGKQHLQNYNAHTQVPLLTSIEIGTGWYPVVPILFYLSGCTTIITIDIAPLVTLAQTKETILKFFHFYKAGKLAHFTEKEISRLEQLMAAQATINNLEELLAIMQIAYYVGGIQHVNNQYGKAQLIHSNNTFEHIHPSALSILLQQCKTCSFNQTIHSHQIDLSDHFSHLDKNISNFNFLKFSKTQWKFIDNSIQPQNRLRINEYRRLIENEGYQIVAEHNTTGSELALNQLKLAKPYNTYSTDDLLVTHTFIVFLQNK